MEITDLSPDDVVLWQWGSFELNATILFTWIVMALLVAVSWLVTRRLAPDPPLSRWQNLLEVLVVGMKRQVSEVSQEESPPFFPLVATLFVFLAFANLLAIIPAFESPAGSLSTTAALALTVFLAVPFYGIRRQGIRGYLGRFVRPTPFMLPFHVLGEFSRTIALAVRLFGNVMSGAKIVMILLAIVPLVFPVLMQALGLLTGLLHAYIFALLATVYIASATRIEREEKGAAQDG